MSRFTIKIEYKLRNNVVYLDLDFKQKKKKNLKPY